MSAFLSASQEPDVRRVLSKESWFRMPSGLQSPQFGTIQKEGASSTQRGRQGGGTQNLQDGPIVTAGSGF